MKIDAVPAHSRTGVRPPQASGAVGAPRFTGKLVGMAKKRGYSERFWSKVDRDGPVPSHRPELGQCWVWTAFRNPAGYGHFRVGGRAGRHELAHRVALALALGRAPLAHVLHKCDNPACVRPEHLFEGTNADNVRDAVEKGRNTRLRGESNGRRRLSEVDVAAVRGSSESLRTLAARYGVSTTAIGKIRRGEAWRHVS